MQAQEKYGCCVCGHPIFCPWHRLQSVIRLSLATRTSRHLLCLVGWAATYCQSLTCFFLSPTCQTWTHLTEPLPPGGQSDAGGAQIQSAILYICLNWTNTFCSFQMQAKHKEIIKEASKAKGKTRYLNIKPSPFKHKYPPSNYRLSGLNLTPSKVTKLICCGSHI